MDKQTLSNYGWLVIVTLVLAIMLALATPFGTYVGDAVVSVANGFVGTSNSAMDEDNISNLENRWNEKLNSNAGSSTPTKDPALNPSGTIPEDAYYGNLNPDTMEVVWYNSMPETVSPYDVYVYGDYIYGCVSDGWHVALYTTEYKELYQTNIKATDRNQTTYGTILESINGHPITNMQETFAYCTALTTAPAIPSSVTSMWGTFMYCSNLITVPVIPNSVTSINSAFEGCTNLTTAPEIPNSVTDMAYTFYRCTSLTGTITINATPNNYYDCLYNTGITEILGDCTIKAEILATK